MIHWKFSAKISALSHCALTCETENTGTSTEESSEEEEEDEDEDVNSGENHIRGIVDLGKYTYVLSCGEDLYHSCLRV